MNERIQAPQRISVGVDGSPGSLTALRWAAALAERSGATVQAVMAWNYPMLSAVPGLPGAVPPMPDMEQASLTSLEQIVSAERLPIPVEPIVAMGSGSQVLIDASQGQDLLVVSRRDRAGPKGLGSTSRHCAIHAGTSVAVIPPDTEPLGVAPTIAVAMDGSDRSINALVWAATTFPGDATFSAVHSHDEQMLDYHDLPDEVREGLRERAEARLGAAVARAVDQLEEPLEVTLHVYEGDPRSTVLDGVWGVDTLVVGDRGHSGVSGLLLGSFATFAVGNAEVPVVVARL